MKKREIILAALYASEGAELSPVQMQKLMFLIDKKIANKISGGPFFSFAPYHYGPFDREVYDTLDELRKEGLVEFASEPGVRWQKYRLNSSGYQKGEEFYKAIDVAVSAYIKTLSSFVRSLSFDQLVSCIYNEYPEMKVNSVFRG